MKLFETKRQKAIFFGVLAITILVWIVLSLWYMSSIHINEDEPGWRMIVAFISSCLFAYWAYCYCDYKDGKVSAPVGAIIAFIISSAIIYFALSFFSEYLISQFISVVLATTVCVIGFIVAIKYIK